MDGKFLLTVASYLDGLEMFPYFNICHYLLISLHLRQISPGNKVFSRQHPLASWSATISMCFAGSFISNFLIGEPLVIPFKYHENILHASLCWYVMNYFPFDLVYKICSIIPVYMMISLGKELYRARMIHIGIAVAAKRYTDSFIVWLIIGLVKGCGEDIFLPLANSFMGIRETSGNFLLNPSFNVKGSLAVAVMFSMEKIQKVPLASTQLFLAAILFLAYFRVSSILVGIKDPFVPFETLICGIFFGGLVDAIREMSRKNVKDSSNKNYTNVTNSKLQNHVNGKGDMSEEFETTRDEFQNFNHETESDINDEKLKKDN